MSFSQLQPTSSDVAESFQTITELARESGFSMPQLSGLTSVIRWKELLTSESPEDREAVKVYLEVFGYLPDNKRILSHAARNTDSIEIAADKLTQAVSAGEITPAAFATQDPLVIKTQFPELSKSQIQILQAIMGQQLSLDTLEVKGLANQFPFPITQTNFFGRFLAGGCEDPQKAARHLQITSPFFVRIRSLLEGLSNPKKRHLTLEITSREERELEEQQGTRGPGPGKSRRAFAQADANRPVHDILHACINYSSDFVGIDSGHKIAVPLHVVEIPRLPAISVDQFEPSQKAALAVALYEWLFFGTKDNPLLTQKKLSVSAEKNYERHKSQLAQKKEDLRLHKKNSPKSDTQPYRVRRWERREEQLQQTIQRLEDSVQSADSERSSIRPLLRQLESDESITTGIRQFRKNLSNSLDSNATIVLSFLNLPVTGSTERQPFLNLLDQALTTKKFNTSPAVHIVRNAPMLFNPLVERAVMAERVGGFGSLVDQQLRAFHIDRDEVSPSLQYVISGILPEKVDPKITLLIDTILAQTELPGISDQKELKYLVRQYSGKRNPGVTEYLEYTFEHSAYLEQEQFLKLLDTLRTLGVAELPERCMELARERFRLPGATVPQFEVFNRRYQPQKLGAMPPAFEDAATFERYMSLKLDSFGMAHEVAAIEKHLCERGVVAIVDGTSYHPELSASIGMTGDTLAAGDAEKTNEIWGDYIRPSERAIRAFSLRLMEGAVESTLLHHSLMTVAKPDKVAIVQQKLIKHFYGIDIDITPSLSEINRLLADLTVHDDKTILVIDAENVTNLQQYREFLDLLERYNLKLILRTREPLPGIPQVNIQPFLMHDIPDRLIAERDSLARKLELPEAPSAEIISFAVEQVERCRAPGADPLNLTLQMLDGAANHARHYPEKIITEQDVVAASAAIFHQPDGKQMQLRIAAIDAFAERAPMQVLGQQEPIRLIASRMKSHILGMRDPIRPLTLLLPGPTGVGKTELMLKFAQACDIPFFMIEGAEFSEEHTVSRLVGSPTGYKGDDKGILYKHLESNSVGLVFIDEIEKMHPSVYQALMNFFDKATLTAGDGTSVTRPGFTIVGASNAGADRLHREMTPREVREVLAESFVDRFNNPRPELVRRFEPIMMLAIEEPDFKAILKANLNSIGKRPGFINANLRLVDVDAAAAELLYETSREVCAYDEKSMTSGNRLGFRSFSSTDMSSELYYDMRHVSRALDDLAGEALQQAAVAQYETGAFEKRGEPKKVKLVGVRNGRDSKSIRLEEVI